MQNQKKQDDAAPKYTFTMQFTEEDKANLDWVKLHAKCTAPEAVRKLLEWDVYQDKQRAQPLKYDFIAEQKTIINWLKTHAFRDYEEELAKGRVTFIDHKAFFEVVDVEGISAARQSWIPMLLAELVRWGFIEARDGKYRVSEEGSTLYGKAFRVPADDDSVTVNAPAEAAEAAE